MFLSPLKSEWEIIFMEVTMKFLMIAALFLFLFSGCGSDGKKESKLKADSDICGDSDAATPADADIFADSDAATPADGDIYADSDAATPADGDIYVDSDAATPADGDIYADSDVVTPADADIYVDADVVTPADDDICVDADVATPADDDICVDADVATPADDDICADADAATPADDDICADSDVVTPADADVFADSDAATPADDDIYVNSDVDGTNDTDPNEVFSGFSSSSNDWFLPQASDIPNDRYNLLMNQGNSSQSHALIDMNGDGKPDIVWTEDSVTPENDLGYTYWKVFLNTGSGFNETPIIWDLPQGGWSSYDSYTKISDQYVANGNYFMHSLVDMNGDGKPDMVWTEDRATNQWAGDAEIGNSYWMVFENTGNGFSETNSEWALPQEELPSYHKYYNTLADQSSYNLRFIPIDMNGDRQLDMVWTLFSEDSEVGEIKWRVFIGGEK